MLFLELSKKLPSRGITIISIIDDACIVREMMSDLAQWLDRRALASLVQSDAIEGQGTSHGFTLGGFLSRSVGTLTQRFPPTVVLAARGCGCGAGCAVGYARSR
jgi:hypothetical protein